jgi:Flp pilus assembly protein protease CpaA
MMEIISVIGGENLFLTALGIIWAVFASVQDIKKKEIANWLSFSLIAFGLVYRMFYSIEHSNAGFVIFGILGFLMFFVFAHLFYYLRVFAGGDAKLLMGFGVILPYSSYWDVLYTGGGFIILLFFAGAVYALGYSLFLLRSVWGRFKKEIKGMKMQLLVWECIAIILAGMFWLVLFDNSVKIMFCVFILVVPFIYVYVKALDKCMIGFVNADELAEGDWLEEDVKIKGGVIKKSVHGLSIEEIIKLRKAEKKVLIKGGILFAPAFLISLIIMVFFWGEIFSFLQSFFLAF